MMQTAQLRTGVALALAVVMAAGSIRLGAQAPVNAPAPAATQATPPSGGVLPPADYVIGPDDALSIIYWDHKEMSADVVVRPDGKITLPLVNDMQAVGLTPDQLRQKITEAGAKFVESPVVTVIVKEIKSRQVSITGQVGKSGWYPINGPMTVIQLIALAGGLQEYADGKHISVLRTEKGQPVSYRFNYDEVVKKRRNLKQNIELKPGDQVVVP
ncbi:MAG TPA: polysaccharide biosynthesis/export family protein [Vicinamibacterales bacterium]|jgi:polysaccharide export outer membrane protein|nr:polysaccharide biosynthesis/export family protein [Vicinamibacterales bacterium]